MGSSLEPEPPVRPQSEELERANDTRGTRVLAGGIWNVAGRFVPQFYTLAISVVAARYLGPSDMGRQSYIAFISLAASSLISSSLWVALVRYVGEAVGRGDAGAVRGLLSWAWRIELAGAAVGGGALTAAALGGATPRGAWILAGAVTAASILQTVPNAFLVGLQQFRRASIVGLTTGVLGTGATVAVLAAGGGISGMFAVELVAGVANLAWTGVIAQRAIADIAPIPAPAGRLKRKVLRYAVGFSAGVVLELIVARRSELVFLDRFSTNRQIAYYSIAYAIVAGVGQIPSALAAATGPAFATLFGAGDLARIARGFNRALRLLLLCTLPLTALGLALGPEVVRLVYGSSYAGAAGPLLILLVAFPLRGLTTLADMVTTAYGRLRLPVTANWVAAGVDVGLAALLIPSLAASGAAMASVAAQLVYLFAMLMYVRRLVAYDRLGAALVRAAIASTIAGAVAWTCLDAVGGAPGLLLGLLAFGAAFVLLAAALRIVPAPDADWIEEEVRGRFGARVARACRRCSSRA